MNRRGQDSGVVLVNVLVVLAIAGGLMVLLISGQETALDRVARSADAARAEQIALGAEASVIDALREDLDRAPDADHLGEPWARRVIQDEVLLPTGKFSVSVTDLAAKFDINLLAAQNLATQNFLKRLLIALDQPPEAGNQIVRVIVALGGIGALSELEAFGVPPDVVAALSPYVTVLPGSGTVNLNSVDGFLLEVMMQNASHASQLISRRGRGGSLTLEDLSEIGAIRPQNSGFVSNAYQADILAEAGSARVRLRTTILRRNALGVKAVDVVERRIIHDAPDGAAE
jgi:general secretion pathway protein K